MEFNFFLLRAVGENRGGILIGGFKALRKPRSHIEQT